MPPTEPHGVYGDPPPKFCTKCGYPLITAYRSAGYDPQTGVPNPPGKAEMCSRRPFGVLPRILSMCNVDFYWPPGL